MLCIVDIWFHTLHKQTTSPCWLQHAAGAMYLSTSHLNVNVKARRHRHRISKDFFSIIFGAVDFLTGALPKTTPANQTGSAVQDLLKAGGLAIQSDAWIWSRTVRKKWTTTCDKAHLSVADHYHAHEDNVDVGSQRLVVVDFINLSGNGELSVTDLKGERNTMNLMKVTHGIEPAGLVQANNIITHRVKHRKNNMNGKPRRDTAHALNRSQQCFTINYLDCGSPPRSDL